MEYNLVGLGIGCILFLWGLSFYKKACKEFSTNTAVGTKEKLFLGAMNFLAAFAGKGDSYVFLGTLICGIGILIIFLSKVGAFN